MAFGGKREIPGSGIADAAARHFDLEIAIAIEREVKSIACRIKGALRHDLAGGLDRHAGTEVEPGCISRFARRPLAGNAGVLIGERRKVGTVALEAGGPDVGEVVRNDAHARILSLEPGAGDLQS